MPAEAAEPLDRDAEAGKRAGTSTSTTASVAKVDAQVKETLSAMQDNMRALAERESQLDSLQARTTELQGSSSAFAKGAKHIRQKETWERYRLYIFGGLFVALLLLQLIFPHNWMWHLITALLACAVGLAIWAFMQRREKEFERAIRADEETASEDRLPLE